MSLADRLRDLLLLYQDDGRVVGSSADRRRNEPSDALLLLSQSLRDEYLRTVRELDAQNADARRQSHHLPPRPASLSQRYSATARRSTPLIHSLSPLLILFLLVGACGSPTGYIAPTVPPPTPAPAASAPTAPAATTDAPAATGWTMVAQFRGSDDFAKTTRVFRMAGPWRLTWLTYQSLDIEVISGRTGEPIESTFHFQSAGPPRVGDVHIRESGDFYLRINSLGYYQIDIEEPLNAAR